jgi:sterol desaturase/sphingolipid hydroxylase (fatty acid hydroxylase superfamily)
VVGLLPLVLLGLPFDVIALAGGVYGAFATFNHANLRIGLGRLEGLLVSPRFHQLHHLPRTTEANLGTILTLWDVLRGTAVRAAVPSDAAFGLPGERDGYPQDWPRQLLRPFADLLALRHRRPAAAVGR